MGFYLRKALSQGPVRFNLSQHGIGLSFGVTGARLGITPSGQVYTHLGRYGLYHKQVLGRVGQRRKTPTQVHRVDTDQTFTPRADYTPRLRSRVNLRELGAIVPSTAKRTFFAVGFTAAALFTLATGGPVVWSATLGTIGLLGWILTARGSRQNTRIRGFTHILTHALWSYGTPAAGPHLEELDRWLDQELIAPRDAMAIARQVYLIAVISAVDDDVFDGDEAARLEWLRKRVRLEDDFVENARADAARLVFLRLVSDRELTSAEERTFTRVCDDLGIARADLTEEAEVASTLRRVRQATSGSLRQITTSVPLGRGEQCYFEAPGRVLSDKNLAQRQRAGVRHVTRGFVTKGEGTLIITDKRIAVVHEKVTAVTLGRIHDVDYEPSESLLTVHKKNVKRPTWFTCARSREAAAILARILAKV